MKKLLTTAALILASATAHSQFYVGGTLGIACESVKTDNISRTNQVYSIAPEAGYNIDKIWAIGMSIGESYAINDSEEYTVFSLSPYIRATFADTTHLKFFVEAAFDYEYCEIDGSGSIDGWAWGLCPGIMANISKKIQLIGRTTLFAYSESGKKSYKTKQIGFAINNNLQIGLLYNF